jgi:uncharacterized protein YjcR
MTDETKGNGQDTSRKGDSSGGSKGSTSKAAFTEEQVQKAVNDALAKAGRTAKGFEAREQAIRDAEARIEEANRQREEAEVESLKDDPEGLKALKAKQSIQKAQADLKKEKADFEKEKLANAERLSRADELELEVNVWKAANAKGVDAEVLKEKCIRYKITSEEDISDLADTLAESKKPSTAELHEDSSKGSGGGGKLTVDEAEKISMDDYAARRQKEDSSLKQ